jgi:hypothetical protein
VACCGKRELLRVQYTGFRIHGIPIVKRAIAGNGHNRVGMGSTGIEYRPYLYVAG